MPGLPTPLPISGSDLRLESQTVPLTEQSNGQEFMCLWGSHDAVLLKSSAQHCVGVLVASVSVHLCRRTVRPTDREILIPSLRNHTKLQKARRCLSPSKSNMRTMSVRCHGGRLTASALHTHCTCLIHAQFLALETTQTPNS